MNVSCSSTETVARNSHLLCSECLHLFLELPTSKLSQAILLKMELLNESTVTSKLPFQHMVIQHIRFITFLWPSSAIALPLKLILAVLPPKRFMHSTIVFQETFSPSCPQTLSSQQYILQNLWPTFRMLHPTAPCMSTDRTKFVSSRLLDATYTFLRHNSAGPFLVLKYGDLFKVLTCSGNTMTLGINVPTTSQPLSLPFWTLSLTRPRR